MDRREFLKYSGTGLGAFGLGFLSTNSITTLGGSFAQPVARKGLHRLAREAYKGNLVQGGWLDIPKLRDAWIRDQARPFLNEMDSSIKGTGAGRVVLLYKFLEEILQKPLPPLDQEIGDCISMGFGRGIDILTAVQILMRNAPQKWQGEAATEIIYAGSRVECGRKYGYNFRGDGSLGVLAAEFVKCYGPLLRKKYLGTYDFTHYSGDLARELGRSGVPDALEPLCKLHPVGYVAIVNSWEESRDCIANGYPIALCSNQGFRTYGGRDKDGFLPPGGTWGHCMLLAGIDDKSSRPGGLIINSWGNFVDGPKRHGQPDGSFWADASVIDRMCKQGDSVALSSYAGYPKNDFFLY